MNVGDGMNVFAARRPKCDVKNSSIIQMIRIRRSVTVG